MMVILTSHGYPTRIHHSPLMKTDHIPVAKLLKFKGSGVVQWSAQKIATPRVSGSNLGSSKFFWDHHFTGKMTRREDDDPSARKIQATTRRSRENEKSGSGDEKWRNRQVNVNWIREMVWFVSKKRTIKWSMLSEGMTWCEKCNVLPTFYSSNYNMSVKVESLI